MNPYQNPDGSDTQLGQLEKIRTTGGGLNPYQQTQYDQLKAAAGNSSTSGASDPIATAQKVLDFQKQANAPVSAALGSQVPGIQQQYTDLVNSIKGNQQASVNQQTLATNNELGRRGILSQSGLGEQDLANALLPVNAQYSGLLANANAGSIQDLQNLALQIAQLNAGNPETALSGAFNIGGLQNQATSLANQFALGQQQIAAGIQEAQIQAQALQRAQQIAQQYQQVGAGNSLINTFNNMAINPGILTAATGYANLGGR